MRDVVVLALLVGSIVVVGVPVCLALGLSPDRRWLPTLLGLAPLVGLLWCGVCAFGLVALGRGARPQLVVPVALVVGIVAWRVRHRLARGGDGAPWPLAEPRARHRRAARVGEALVLMAYVPVAVALLRVAGATAPGWDGWAIWGLKAEALYHEGSLGGAVFLDPFYLGSHQEYPVLQPALAATAAHALGRFDTALADVPGALAVVLGGVAVWALLRTRMPGPLAAGTGLAALASWPLGVNATDGYADALLAVCVAVGVLCTTLHVLWRSPTALALGCAFLATSGLVKSEGLAFAAAAALALVAAASVEGRRRRTALVPAVAILAPGLVWVILRGAWVGVDTIDSGRLTTGGIGATWARSLSAAAELGVQLAESWALGLLLVVAGGALALLGRRVAAVVFVAVWLAGAVASLVLVYALAPTDLDWHLETSAARVVLAIGLSASVVGPLLALEGWTALGRPRVVPAATAGATAGAPETA